MPFRTKAILSVIVILLVAAVLAYAAKMFNPFYAAAIPIWLYAVLGFAAMHFWGTVPREAEQLYRDKEQSASLTLAGFGFTSLSLVISFFKDELKGGDSAAVGILSFFSLALAFFIMSHLILRFRGKYLFFLMSDAAMDSGFWCIFLGVWVFINRAGVDAVVFLLLLCFYLVVMLIHFWNWLSFAEPDKVS